MKKIALLLVVIIAFSIFALASCKKTCKEHVDADGNYVCDKCEAELKKPDDPTPPAPDADPNCEHKDDNKDHKCDSCGGALSECKDEDNDHKCEYCGATVSECKDEDKNHKCDTCDTAMGEHAAPANNHKCDYCGKNVTYCVDDNEDNRCDVCNVDVERVSYELNVSGLNAGKKEDDDIQGKFTIIGGTEIRTRTRTYNNVEYTKSVKMGSDSNGIKVDVPGNGKLSFLVQNGSSGKEYQQVLITAPDGTTQEIEFDGTISSSPVVEIKVDVTPGEWTISRIKSGGTIDVFYLSLSAVVEKSEECDFELVTTGNVDYLMGAELDVSGLRLNGIYGSGKTEPLSANDYTVDTSAVDMNKSGAYEIAVSYKSYAPIKYSVYVYEPSSVKLGLDAIEKIANTSYGNGVYYNNSFKEVYTIGEELDTTGLSVIVVASCGDKTIEFRTDDYELVGFSSAEAGEKTLTISYEYQTGKTVSATIKVYVVDVQITPDSKGVVQALVDPEYDGNIAALEGSYHMFSTIQQALDFLAKADAKASKKLSIKPGQYNEKLEITIPNLTIVGLGEDPDDVIIEWDSLYDIKDAGGFNHTTDSTATVAVREAAVNCTIENLIISNFWNSLERFDEHLGAGYPEHRALALLVQSDKFIMRNAKLLGYQDTVEFFTGRQYLYNVYISGTTDFIFGTNSTTLFEECQIHSITNGKTDGGYITAFKGCNKGSSDYVDYGAIFYKCEFTADEDVVANKNTAIGRCWDAYAAVAVIECEIAGHVSTKAFSGSTKNERYVSMNAKPTDATVKFVEFGNTGAGAITTAVAGMKLLTADEAALYHNLETVFGKKNGNVNFTDAWDPSAEEIPEDDKTYYYFDGTTGITGTFYNYEKQLQNAEAENLGGLLIDSTSSKVYFRVNDNDTQVNAGAKFTINVLAGTVVTVETYSTSQSYLINGVGPATDTESFSRYFAEDTQVVIEFIGTVYLHKIIINPSEDALETATVTEIKAEGFKTTYTVGDELSLDGVVVRAFYSNNSFATISDYTVNSDAVNSSEAGTYDVVFSFGGKSQTVQVTYEADNSDPTITVNTVLSFASEAGLNEIKNNPRVTIAKDSSFRANGGNHQAYLGTVISFQVKAGTIVKVNPYHDSKYVSYTLGVAGAEGLENQTSVYTFTATEDCVVAYTSTSDNNYLVSIEIVMPRPSAVRENAKAVFNVENIDKMPAAVDTLGATFGEVKSDCAQFSAGEIKITLFAGATLNIVNYGGVYTNYSVYDVDGNMISPEGGVTGEGYTFTTQEDMIVVLKPNAQNNYIKSIDITYPAE